LIIQPASPLFTPLGLSVTRSVFAHLSKMQDRNNVLHCAIQGPQVEVGTDEAVPWEPSFYVLRDLQHRQIVLVFRGTQTLRDISASAHL
jgi:hypothetical protein